MKELNSEFHNEIFSGFVRLLLDVVSTIFLICIFIFISRIKNTLTRFIALYKEKRRKDKLQQKHQIDIIKAKDQISSKSILTLSYISYPVIFSFCSFITIHSFEQTSKKSKAICDRREIWIRIYVERYKKIKQIKPSKEINYREECIKIEKNEIDKRKQLPIERVERDKIIGWKLVVFDEFIETFRNILYVPILPVIILSFIFILIRRISLTFRDFVRKYRKFSLIGCFLGDTIVTMLARALFNININLYQDNFKKLKRVHEGLLFSFLIILDSLHELVGYFYCHLLFYLVLFGSDGIRYQINIQNENNHVLGQLIGVPPVNTDETYISQVKFIPLILILILSPFLFCPLLLFLANFNLYYILIGPYFISIFSYIYSFWIIINYGEIFRFFPYFNPYQGMRIRSARAAVKLKNIVKKVLSVISSCFKFLFTYIINPIFSGIFKVIIKIFNSIFKVH